MSTKKIEEALTQARQEARNRQDWHTITAIDVATVELNKLRCAMRIWQEDLDASKSDAHKMHDLFTAIAEEELIP